MQKTCTAHVKYMQGVWKVITCNFHAKYLQNRCKIQKNDATYMQRKEIPAKIENRCKIHVKYMQGACKVHAKYMQSPGK